MLAYETLRQLTHERRQEREQKRTPSGWRYRHTADASAGYAGWPWPQASSAL